MSHIYLPHGDTYHCWYSDRVGQNSKASVVCGKGLIKTEGEEKFLLDPRKRGLQYSTRLDRIYSLDVGETIHMDGVKTRGLKSLYGPVVVYFLFGLIRSEFAPGPGERVGMGAIGYQITDGDTTLVNLAIP